MWCPTSSARNPDPAVLGAASAGAAPGRHRRSREGTLVAHAGRAPVGAGLATGAGRPRGRSGTHVMTLNEAPMWYLIAPQRDTHPQTMATVQRATQPHAGRRTQCHPACGGGAVAGARRCGRHRPSRADAQQLRLLMRAARTGGDAATARRRPWARRTAASSTCFLKKTVRGRHVPCSAYLHCSSRLRQRLCHAHLWVWPDSHRSVWRFVRDEPQAARGRPYGTRPRASAAIQPPPQSADHTITPPVTGQTTCPRVHLGGRDFRLETVKSRAHSHLPCRSRTRSAMAVPPSTLGEPM
jgi:hypothetical protein